jgi:hypothetical protein
VSKLNRYKTNGRPGDKAEQLNWPSVPLFRLTTKHFIYLYLADLGFACLLVANPVTPAEERSSYRVNLSNYMTSRHVTSRHSR